MSNYKKYTVAEKKHESTSMKSYVFGFVCSIILTLAAYFLATEHVFSGYVLITVLIELAILQFAAQLFLFLHLTKNPGKKWRLLTVVLMLVFVLILVLGSIWIMDQLNYNMSPDQQLKWIHSQSLEGF